MIQALAPLQFFLLPGIILLLLWSIWRTVIKRDKAMGLALYVTLVIILDAYMELIIPITKIIGSKYGSVRYTDLLLIWLFFIDGPNRRSQITQTNVLRKKMLFLLSCYAILFLFAAFRGATVGAGLAQFRIVVLKPILIFYIASAGLSNESEYKKFLIYLVIMGLVFTTASAELKLFDRLYLKGIAYYKDLFWLRIRREGRIGGFFTNPNPMGNFCVMLIPIHLLGLKMVNRMSKKIPIFIGTLGLIFALLLTESRGSFFGAFISIALLLLLPVGGVKISKKVFTSIVVVGVFLLLMPGALEKLSNRLDSLKGEEHEVYVDPTAGAGGVSAENRLAVWREGFIIGMTSPIFGIGLGEGKFHIVSDILRRKGKVTITLDHAHSTYVNLFIQTGLINLLIFLLFNGIFILTALKIIRKKPSSDLLTLLSGNLMGIIGFCVCMISQNSIFKGDVSTLYWVLLGVACSIAGRITYEKTDGKNRIKP